tara:strand:+ start:1021 stop:1215 length:195 start_codon:yes stop_codon:yes gene_type:complete
MQTKPTTCEYFASCGNQAAVIIHDPLPFIGDVPTCADCNDRLLNPDDMGPDDRQRTHLAQGSDE